MNNFGKLILSAVIGILFGAVIGKLIIIIVKDETTKTLICSNVIIVSNVKNIHLISSGVYGFSGGSYTPKQGEICLIERNDVK